MTLFQFITSCHLLHSSRWIDPVLSGLHYPFAKCRQTRSVWSASQCWYHILDIRISYVIRDSDVSPDTNSYGTNRIQGRKSNWTRYRRFVEIAWTDRLPKHGQIDWSQQKTFGSGFVTRNTKVYDQSRVKRAWFRSPNNIHWLKYFFKYSLIILSSYFFSRVSVKPVLLHQPFHFHLPETKFLTKKFNLSSLNAL